MYQNGVLQLDNCRERSGVTLPSEAPPTEIPTGNTLASGWQDKE